MNARTALFLAASSAAAAPDVGEGRWAPLPANPAAGLSPAVVVAPVPDETWITLVGARPAVPSAVPVKPVVAVALPLPAVGPPTSPEPVPAEARWPDAAGRIVEPAAGGAAAAERNPWVPLTSGRAARTEEFHYGGFIAGGAGGPVALVNGRSVRRGDVVGGFTVERVLRAAVVLARAGALYAIPLRIPTTIVLRSA